MRVVVGMKPAAARKPPEDLVEVFDEVEQGGDEWRKLRMGIPTASVFADVMSEGRDGPDTGVRANLMRHLAAEVIFERPMETFASAAMLRGKDHEPWLLEQYDAEMHSRAWARGEEHPGIRRVAFIRRTIRDPLMTVPLFVGCSPDGLVGEDGVIEAKSMRPDLLVKLLDSGRFPSEHRWQTQGSLWVTGRRWCDLCIGYEGFPLRAEYRVEWSATDAQALRNQCEIFVHELRKLVERVKQKGAIR